MGSYHLAVSDYLKRTWEPLILEWLDILSASMGIQEEIPVKNMEEILASLAVAAPPSRHSISAG